MSDKCRKSVIDEIRERWDKEQAVGLIVRKIPIPGTEGTEIRLSADRTVKVSATCLTGLFEHLKAEEPELLLALLGRSYAPGHVFLVIDTAHIGKLMETAFQVTQSIIDNPDTIPEWARGKYGISVESGKLVWKNDETVMMEVPVGHWIVTHGLVKHVHPDENFRRRYRIALDAGDAYWPQTFRKLPPSSFVSQLSDWKWNGEEWAEHPPGGSAEALRLSKLAGYPNEVGPDGIPHNSTPTVVEKQS